MDILKLLSAAKKGIQGAAWWARFEAWRKERDAKRAKELEDAKRAAKLGLVLVAAWLTIGASCKTTIKDLAEYCRERPWECGAGTPPPPRSTPTVAPSATVPAATPAPTATSAPTPSLPADEAVTIAVTPCILAHDDRTLRPAFAVQVRAAIVVWLDLNLEKWRQHAALPSVLPEHRRSFYVGVVSNLRGVGLDAVVDACLCGEIAVAARGGIFHEQYHVLVSDSGDVHWPLNGGESAGFVARCEPRGFRGCTAYVPPRMDFWRGCGDSNMTREVAEDGTGRARRFCDTTILWQCPMVPSSVGGSRSCDPEHATVFADCCSSRRADDPRGPIFRVTTTSGGPVVVRQPCRNGNHHNACFFAPTGTVALIDTCPRPDAYTCVRADELANKDTGVKYDPANPATDCPSGKVPLVIGGRGCYGAEEVRF